MPAAYAIDRMIVTPHVFTVPLDWDNPDDGRTIQVFAREIVAADKKSDPLPYICYFQGGPGFEAVSPTSRGNGGVFGKVLERYRVVMLDQRGTGLSSAIDGPSLGARATDEQVEYLQHFRQGSIVRDAEHVRKQLVGENNPWAIYGQSFGGWCSLSYLSMYPENLSAAFIFGGFAPVGHSPDEVYSVLVNRVKERNELFLKRFPDDADRIAVIIDALETSDQRLPSGERVRANNFLQMGSQFGFHHEMASAHFAIERAAQDLAHNGKLSVHSLNRMHDPMGVTTNPIYALLHEAIYCEGLASNWSASRIVQSHSEFDITNGKPYFAGEMIFPWMFEQYEALKPLQESANLIASHEWPSLYDTAKLAEQQVPVVGTVYYEDLYVDRGFSLETTKLLGNCSPWITNEFEHDGLRNHPDELFTRLFNMHDELIKP